MQVANGWPLYYFARDEVLGDVECQGLNDVWWALDPDGSPVTDLGSRSHDGEGLQSPSENTNIEMVSDDGHHLSGSNLAAHSRNHCRAGVTRRPRTI
ncbi:hypothetical protein [Natrinema sp. SYSU A 869]|uniref:hypothetical protein n=1 Tax=Natrinema sp. SYSU A 869 TaxID=2871694 RepID=UPI00210737D0|nr:hypothetical protein [Natrinema sp. SYSU A 869]